jgi:hypothetical protein
MKADEEGTNENDGNVAYSDQSEDSDIEDKKDDKSK